MKQTLSSILFIISACILAVTATLTHAQILAGANGVVILKGTSGKYAELSGTVSFRETDKGLVVNADVKNVPPGKHGFHVHEKGDCAKEGNAAGGHYNPHGVTHGFLPTDGHEKAHTGDMGNITVAEDGTGKLEVTLQDVHLSGDTNNISGLAVILHEKEDNFGQPTGNAGGRIGCGIITPAQGLP